VKKECAFSFNLQETKYSVEVIRGDLVGFLKGERYPEYINAIRLLIIITCD
jgi:hypothetical protein